MKLTFGDGKKYENKCKNCLATEPEKWECFGKPCPKCGAIRIKNAEVVGV